MNPDQEAAAAAKRAEKKFGDMPPAVLIGVRIGKCHNCGQRFEYGTPGAGANNLDPSPCCNSWDWEKWGYKHEEEEIPLNAIRTEVKQEDI